MSYLCSVCFSASYLEKVCQSISFWKLPVKEKIWGLAPLGHNSATFRTNGERIHVFYKIEQEIRVLGSCRHSCGRAVFRVFSIRPGRANLQSAAERRTDRQCERARGYR